MLDEFVMEQPMLEVSKLGVTRLEAFKLEVSKLEVVTRLVEEVSTMLVGIRLLSVGSRLRLDAIARLQEGSLATKGLVDTMLLSGGQE